MEISGKYTIYAPRDRVWEALLDPDVLQRTVPGCEQLEREGADRYRVRLNVNVAAVKGSYDGTLRISDIERPEHYHIAVDGSGARGVLRGEGTVRLEAIDDGETVINYAGQAQLGGTIASVGSRVAQGAAELLLKQYFARLADTLGDAQGQPVAAVATATVNTSIPAHPGADARHVIGRATGESAPPAATGAASRAAAPRATTEAPRRGPLMRFAHSSGLSDGSIESERRIARLLAGSTAALVALIVAGIVVGLGISGRRR